MKRPTGRGNEEGLVLNIKAGEAGDSRRLPVRLRFRTFLVWLYYQVSLSWNFWFGRAPIMVYQMGKVGSTTVVKSIEAILEGRPVYQIHHLTEEGLEFNRRFSLATRRISGKHYWLGHFFRRRICRPNRDWTIVTLVRDPVARNVSTFFQWLQLFFPELDPGLVDESAMPDLIEAMRASFLDRFPHDLPLRWFDHELKAKCGIDVFSKKFPWERGYKIYRNDRCHVLLIRLEDLDECASQAFAEFIGLENVQILRHNEAENKEYASLYRTFRKSVVLPEEYIDRMYDSRYARHFYSPSEIESLRAKWVRNETAADGVGGSQRAEAS